MDIIFKTKKLEKEFNTQKLLEKIYGKKNKMKNTMINQYYPDYISPPGETLEEILEDRGMASKDLAKQIGQSEKTIDKIINGKAEITEETALQLELVLGIPAHFWNNRERRYREFLAKQDQQKTLVINY